MDKRVLSELWTETRKDLQRPGFVYSAIIGAIVLAGPIDAYQRAQEGLDPCLPIAGSPLSELTAKSCMALREVTGRPAAP